MRVISNHAVTGIQKLCFADATKGVHKICLKLLPEIKKSVSTGHNNALPVQEANQLPATF